MKYKPSPSPQNLKDLPSYVDRELQRIAATLSDEVYYRTLAANQGSLTAGISANWKIARGNVVRVSTSVTLTLTGLVLPDLNPWLREIVVINVGTGTICVLSDDSASSASYRFLLSNGPWNLSANAAAVFWADPYSARLRGLYKSP